MYSSGIVRHIPGISKTSFYRFTEVAACWYIDCLALWYSDSRVCFKNLARVRPLMWIVVVRWRPIVPMTSRSTQQHYANHDDVIKWKHFPRYWPFLRGIHRSPVNSPHKTLWLGAFMFSLIWALINGWVNNREPRDWRRHCAYYDVSVMHILSLNPLDMNIIILQNV